MTTTHRGFTLIELLVVIAIIGVLATVIMNSVNTVRAKGKDAAAKSDLNAVRPTASNYYDDNNSSYGTAGVDCANPDSVFDPSVQSNVNTAIVAAQGAVNSTAVCANDPFSFVVAIPLLDGTTWCIDSTGYSNVTTLLTDGSSGSVQDVIRCQ